MRPFNDLSDAEQSALIKGPFGRELLKAIEACVLPLHWTDGHASDLPNNGSALIVKTEKALFGITARHVYDAYKELADHDGSAVCRLFNLKIDLRPRLISSGKRSDLATFQIL